MTERTEDAEGKTRAYKENYEEAMHLLGMQAYRTDPPAEQPRNRKEYWWVRHKGMIVPGAVNFRDNEPVIVLFFGTELTAKPDEVEMLTRLSQMSVPEGGWPAANAAVRKVFDAFRRSESRVVESEYGDGYHMACNHVLKAIHEAANAGAIGDPRKLAEEKLDRFIRCVSSMMGVRYAAGYREACTNIINALAGEDAAGRTDQGKEG